MPTSGNALFIGTNLVDDVRPAALSAGALEYSLFDCYAAGVYVRDYSPGGAYVFTATGGHNCPPVTGAILFDFVDATWKRLDNANGAPWRASEYTAADVNSELEISTTGTTPNTVPAPFHTYQLLAAGPGPKGSVITVITQFALDSASSSTRSHRLELATGTWSRASTNTAMHTGFTSVRDPATNRIYLLPSELHSVNQLTYLDGTDSTWKTESLGAYPATQGSNNTSFIEPTAHLLLAQSAMGTLRAVELDAIGNGVKQLNVTGTFSSSTTSTRWERDPGSGAFYNYPGTGQTLYKLQPPASAPLTAAWVVSTVAIAGVTMPPDRDTGNGSGHYTRFFYVPPLDCFAWVGNYGSRVVLLKP